ncbi:MAG: precorrin-6A reductase [Blautia sp.]|nr:precorrin-6A reductase [Blautia sp.]MCM1202145.1 precorrin-6A reductase [Bacteroides fragilis]
MSGETPKIVIFAGTTEGRKLSECLAEAGIRHTVCVATAYGEIVLKRNSFAEVHQGRMDREEIAAFLKKGRFAAVVDATHPYAGEITQNIKDAAAELAAQGMEISCFRLNRDRTAQRQPGQAEGHLYFETHEACAEALAHTEGNILLTTGSRALSDYCLSGAVRRRLYVRVLPSVESLSLCMEQGICGQRIIAMQGPFTAEMNEAVIRQYRISHLVTKESGVSGGYPEKLEAAARTGTQVYVIGRPAEEEGYSFSGLCGKLETLCGKKIPAEGGMEIVLAGAGMGHADCLTKEAEKAINGADILLGAERMLENLPDGPEKRPFYKAEQILPYLREKQEKNTARQFFRAVVLFSGDSGFYSGCRTLYAALEKEIREGRLRASLRILPGISSVAYLAARIGESYQDAAVYSIHGKELRNLVRRIGHSPRTFLLTSGLQDINRLGAVLTEAGMQDCEIVTGYRLSCDGQRIERHTPAECCALKEEGLYTCFVRNPRAQRRRLTHGMADARFIRDKAPMTKEEVREISICKLRLREGAVVYDIGSGTGSIAVEIAALSDDIQVYAVEKNKEAVSLIERNKEKFRLQNITVTEAAAPEGLAGLPAAGYAFIGGSGGRLKEIIEALRRSSPKMRIVLNAVSMETICEIKEILAALQIGDAEIIQIQVSRAQKAGDHHLMRAENPVWVCAFDLAGKL